MTMFFRLCVVSLLLCGWTLPVQSQSPIAKARERFSVCKELLDSGKGCAALKACEEGIAARDVGHLRSLADKARKACVKQTREERARRRAERACPQGQERIGSTCCWAGQTLDPVSQACTGAPSACPKGMQVDTVGMTCTDVPCEDGRSRVDGGHCCWPRQVYVDEQARCIGIPECPSGKEAVGEVCETAKPDQDKDGIEDDNDQCPTVAEDQDGFEDGDGCPEYDNDGDGICDAYFTRQLGLEDSSFEELTCSGFDGCPDVPEDLDGFEDGDGCAELDNDQDGIEDSKDLCVDVAGIPLHNGCPPPPDYTMMILGWSGVGAGVALLATGTGLMLSTVDDRETLNNPRFSTERGDIVVNLTEREARDLEDSIATKETAAVVTFGLGGAFLAAGTVLLILDVLDSESDVGMSVAPTDPEGQGAMMTVFGRW